jgi:hypothetical protein
MPKNTRIVVIILTILAALVVGVNIGNKFNPTLTGGQDQKTSPTKAQSPVITPTPKISLSVYQSAICGISFSYPKSLTLMDVETGGAMLIDSKNPAQSIAVICQKDIPRPALPINKTESGKVGTISATLYHDSSAKDGTPVDKLIFTNPKTKMDIFVSGTGDSFKTVTSTLEVR